MNGQGHGRKTRRQTELQPYGQVQNLTEPTFDRLGNVHVKRNVDMPVMTTCM